MSKNNVLLYHTDNDGFGAAFAFSQYHPDSNDFDYVEYEYGSTLPHDLELYERIFFCDVTPDLGDLKDLLLNGCRVTIIDHHVSFADRLEESGLLENHGLDLGFYYSPDHSGTYLAYAFCWFASYTQPIDGLVWDTGYFPRIKAPILFQYIQDRDLWNWELDDSREINAGLDSVNKGFATWAKYLFDVTQLYDLGRGIVTHIDATVQMIAKQTLDVWEDGRFGLCNCTSHWSEVGNYIVDELGYETAFLYYDLGNSNRKWSIRGNNARKFAEIAGGGGHPNAAGFIEDQDIEGWAANTLEWILNHGVDQGIIE